ncbi:PAS domain S-box protein [Candidatus Latescibacterota bacterium]
MKFESRLSTIIDTIPDIIYQLDCDGNISFINKAVTNYGYGHDELIGKSIFSLVHPEDRKKARYHINERRTEKRATKSFEIRLLAKNNCTFECSVSSQKIFRDPVISLDAEGVYDSQYPNEKTFIGTQGIARDVSDCRQAQKALKKKEKNYRFLIENQTDMVIKMDISGKILFVSPSYCEMFGKTKEELISKSFMPLVFEEDSKATIDAMANLLVPPYSCYMEHRIMTVKGWKWVAWNDKAILDKNDEIIAIVGIGRDITERKNLEAQFLQSQKMETVAQLAGGIAHDFNNMLTVMLGYAEMSLMNLSSEDSLYGNITEISKTANRAANLTRQLLAFSRRQIIEPQNVNLNEVLYDMDKMLRRLVDDNIEFITIPSEDLWSVRIDPGQIEQVFSNLVVNARDSMPDGGKIIVETANITLDDTYVMDHIAAKKGDYVMISVSDTGHGMDDETRLHIFEPFFTTKEKDKGTGLGLSTCYGIVKQNNGNIWTYSEPGYGTTFKIYLPRVTNSSIEIKQNEDIDEIANGTETILIAEDEPSLRKIAASVLRKKGYTVLEASDGSEALGIAKEYSPKDIHLVVTDIVMPHMGGKELSERIVDYYPEIKILYMSGYTDKSIVHQGVLKPGIKFLQKPFSPRKIVQKVWQILEN